MAGGLDGLNRGITDTRHDSIIAGGLDGLNRGLANVRARTLAHDDVGISIGYPAGVPFPSSHLGYLASARYPGRGFEVDAAIATLNQATEEHTPSRVVIIVPSRSRVVVVAPNRSRVVIVVVPTGTANRRRQLSTQGQRKGLQSTGSGRGRRDLPESSAPSVSNKRKTYLCFATTASRTTATGPIPDQGLETNHGSSGLEKSATGQQQPGTHSQAWCLSMKNRSSDEKVEK